MKIIAFETSCDDTSIAVFEDEKMLFMDTMSQIKVHLKTGWVVPEIAAREHANNIFSVLNKVLSWVWIELKNIDYIAVTMSPWLLPSLLTWITVTRTLSNILKIPLIEINHIEAHIFANYLERNSKDIEYPLVCLTVSGGHNEIYYMKNMFSFEKLWATTDDAAWEVFDKVAKMMWLGYPGWPIISKLAWNYNWKPSFSLPRVFLDKEAFNFSFSGLKSAVKREIDNREKDNWSLNLEDKREISFEFQNAVIEVLVYKLINAGKKKNVRTIMLAWWVSANDKLIDLISDLAKKLDLNFLSPVKKIYSMDNAAMVWINAYYKIKNWQL